jgi:hypothetical protein
LFVILGFVAGFIGYKTPRSDDNFLNDLGNFGSYLQGTTASFWSLAGLLIIFVAFLAQKQQLKRQETELEEQAKQFRMQHEAPSERHLLKIISPESAAPDGAENILIFVSTNMPRPRRWTNLP